MGIRDSSSIKDTGKRKHPTAATPKPKIKNEAIQPITKEVYRGLIDLNHYSARRRDIIRARSDKCFGTIFGIVNASTTEYLSAHARILSSESKCQILE